MMSGSDPVFHRQLGFRLLDPVVLCGTMTACAVARWGEIPADHLAYLGLVVGVTTVVFNLTGVYDALRDVRLDRWCFAVVRGLALAIGMLLAMAYATKTSEIVSRLVVGSWAASSALVLIGTRVLEHRVARSRHRRGLDTEQVVLAGDIGHCLAFARHLKRHPELGMRATALVSQAQRLEDRVELGEQSALVSRELGELPALIDRFRATRVVICGGLEDTGLVLEIMRMLVNRPINLHYAPDYSTIPIFAFRIGECAGRPIMDLSASPWSDQARAVKWIEDKAFALVVSVVSLPVMLLIALAIKVTSPGPVFFVQPRHGLHGRVIRVFKFRTMRVEAAVPAVAPAALGAAGGAEVASDDESGFSSAADSSFRQAVRGDPRVTPIGRFLRASSLDELPQFLNVLRGDMSVVGPRPHAVAHNGRFVDSIGDLMRRHYVKPGITGLAQISGARGETRTVEAMRRRVQYDLEYIRSWSLWLDLKIIALTVIRGFYNRQP